MRTRARTAAVVLTVALASSRGLPAQERPIPKDSTRVTVAGCAKGRTFISAERSAPEPVRSNIQPGRRFRLSASKTTLADIKKQERTMIEVTGLVRTGQLAGPGGVSVLGGRVRIGGGPPVSSDPTRNPNYDEVVMDVESWRPLPDACPAR